MTNQLGGTAQYYDATGDRTLSERAYTADEVERQASLLSDTWGVGEAYKMLRAYAAALRQQAGAVDGLVRELRDEAKLHYGSNTAAETADLLNRAADALARPASSEPASGEAVDAEPSIRWVDPYGVVHGHPTDHDVRLHLQGNPYLIGCHCDECAAFYTHPAEPVKVPEAAKSAAKFLLERFDKRPCDSSGVSDCIRCNVVALSRLTLAAAPGADGEVSP